MQAPLLDATALEDEMRQYGEQINNINEEKEGLAEKEETLKQEHEEANKRHAESTERDSHITNRFIIKHQQVYCWARVIQISNLELLTGTLHCRLFS